MRDVKGLRPTRAGQQVDPYLQNLARLAELKRQPPIKTPPLPFPHAAEASYRRKLTRIADQAFAIVRPLIDLLLWLDDLARIEQSRTDAEEGEDYPPAPEGVVMLAQRGTEREMARRAAEQNKPHTTAQKAQLALPTILERTIVATQQRLDLFARGIPKNIPAAVATDIERHAVAVNLRVFESVGVNPIKPGSALDRARDRWLADNAALITSQPLEVSARIESIVRDMVPAGARWETIARKLQDEEGIAQRRAALIARDQTAKYNSDCNRTQQQAAGFSHYEWIGVMDNRERPTHVALQHTVWSWEKPPPIGNPGEPIQCRCTASPVTSGEQIAQTQSWDEQELIARTADLGPTHRQGPGATEAQVQARASSEVASEIRLAGRRAEVAAR